MSNDEDRVLGEHERPDMSEKDELKQSPEEKKLVRKIEKWFKEDKEYRTRYDQDWLEYYKMFRGKQWKEDRPAYRHSEVINFIFSTIQSMVPILTDSRPKFDYQAQEPSDIEFNDILNQSAEHDWTKYNWLSKLTEVIYDGHIFGTSYGHLCWDPEAEKNAGAIKFESIDPFHVYPHKGAQDINVDSRRIIYARPMSLDEIKRRWPSKGKYVKPDIESSENDKSDLGKMKYKTPTDNYVYQGGIAQDIGKSDEALVIEIYYKDDEVHDEKKAEEQKEGEKETYVSKRKYPNGRRSIIAGKVLLQDEPNPYNDGKFPFQKYVNYILPREFFGESEVAQLKSPQQIFNKMVSFALDVLTLMGNPIWVVDDEAGVDVDALFNRPGLVVEKAAGTEVRREEGVQLQPYVLSLIDRMKMWFEDVSGLTDVSKGATPAGVKAGIAITALQEAAQTRLRQKSRNLDVFLNDMGEQYKNRVMQFYTVPRMIRLTNNQNASKYFKFNVESQTDDEGNEFFVANLQNYQENPETGQMIPGEVRKVEVKGDFDTKVNTGTLLPFNKASKEAKLLEYYRSGLIDAEEVLKNTDDFPHWETIMQRMAEKQQQQAMQAIAQPQ